MPLNPQYTLCYERIVGFALIMMCSSHCHVFSVALALDTWESEAATAGVPAAWVSRIRSEFVAFG